MSDVPHLIGRRTAIACLVLAPACEVVEALLSPLPGTGTHADLVAVQGHQAAFAVSVLVGLLGTLLYVPAFVGLATLVASRGRRLAVAGGLLCGLGMLAFAGVRMVSAIELQSVAEPLSLASASRAVDGLAGNAVVAGVLALFLACTALGYPLLAAASWRAGLPRPAAVWWGVFPFVAFFVDDLHWGNVATHVLLLGSLAWIGLSLRGPAAAGLTPQRLLSTRALVVLLVLAPALEVLEQVLSPLAGTSTREDVVAAAAHQTAFLSAVLVGSVATLLYVPAFVGLASRCVVDSPAAARIGAAASVVCMAGFTGVRVVQGFELQAGREGLAPSTTAHLVDHLSGNPIGATVLVMFLGGSMVALVALAVAAWRHGLPRPAAVALGLFPFLDLAAPGRAGTMATHLLLLATLTWLAAAIARAPERAGVRRPVEVGQPA